MQAKYFEKIVSMCVGESNGCSVQAIPNAYLRGNRIEKKSKEKGTKVKGGRKLDGKTSSGKFVANNKSITSKLSMASLPTHSSTLPQKTDVPTPVSSSLLCTCLDFFIHTLQYAPDNTFKLDNSDKVYNILRPCFMRTLPPRPKPTIDFSYQCRPASLTILRYLRYLGWASFELPC